MSARRLGDVFLLLLTIGLAVDNFHDGDYIWAGIFACLVGLDIWYLWPWPFDRE